MVPNLSKLPETNHFAAELALLSAPKGRELDPNISQPFFRGELAVSFKELDSILVHSTRWGILPSCDPHRNRRNQTGKNGEV